VLLKRLEHPVHSGPEHVLRRGRLRAVVEGLRVLAADETAVDVLAFAAVGGAHSGALRVRVPSRLTGEPRLEAGAEPGLRSGAESGLGSGAEPGLVARAPKPAREAGLEPRPKPAWELRLEPACAGRATLLRREAALQRACLVASIRARAGVALDLPADARRAASSGLTFLPGHAAALHRAQGHAVRHTPALVAVYFPRLASSAGVVAVVVQGRRRGRSFSCLPGDREDPRELPTEPRLEPGGAEPGPGREPGLEPGRESGRELRPEPARAGPEPAGARPARAGRAAWLARRQAELPRARLKAPAQARASVAVDLTRGAWCATSSLTFPSGLAAGHHRADGHTILHALALVTVFLPCLFHSAVGAADFFQQQ